MAIWKPRSALSANYGADQSADQSGQLRRSRFRLLPVMMVGAAALFVVKINAIAAAADAVLGGKGQTTASSSPAALSAIAPSSGDAKTAATPAEEKAADQKKPDADPAAEPEADPNADPNAPAGAEFLSKSEIDLLQDLANRRGQLESKAQDIETRERLLMATEKRIDKKIERLKALETQIKDLVRVHEEREEKQIASLVRVYESMKPKDAARIFEKLDMPILLDVIQRMKDKKVALVMSEMNPEKAKSVTVELATRKDIPVDQPTAGN